MGYMYPVPGRKWCVSWWQVGLRKFLLDQTIGPSSLTSCFLPTRCLWETDKVKIKAHPSPMMLSCNSYPRGACSVRVCQDSTDLAWLYSQWCYTPTSSALFIMVSLWAAAIPLVQTGTAPLAVCSMGLGLRDKEILSVPAAAWTLDWHLGYDYIG